MNRSRNIDYTTIRNEDLKGKPKERSTRIGFAEYHTEIYTDGEVEENYGTENDSEVDSYVSRDEEEPQVVPEPKAETPEKPQKKSLFNASFPF